MKKNILFTVIMIVAGLFIVATSFASDKPVKDTVMGGITYTIFEGAKGGKFINKVSKTGTQYKQYLSSLKAYKTPSIDLPEEWMTISTDKNKPTTLTGYIVNGKLFIEFKN